VSAGKVLVTGHRGRLGGGVGEALVGAGYDWVGFDLDEGDIRDHAALAEAAAGCDAIVHLAGLADDMSDDQMEKMSVNAMGTWSVLLAAEAAGIDRIVNFSSGKAIGMTERLPDYVPIDDDHPAISTKDYGLSKLFSEDMCEAYTRRTGATTVCLRPVAVFGPADYPRWEGFLAEETETVDVPWHMGVFVDVVDTADAAVLALAPEVTGHHRLLLCADDVAAEGRTEDLVRRRMPSVPWRGPLPADERTALVSSAGAKRVLGWRPAVRWDARG
jgi:nucleoside-diphosphate-sugar epimerase